VAWGIASTVTSNGSVNSMHESWRPLTGLMALNNILLGEIVYGGVGSGLYGMLGFVLLTVFMAGLMVGRSPEALGKKVEAREVKLVVAILLLPNAAVLIGASLAVLLPQGLAGLNNAGPHGLSEILYAFASAGQNNGSAFAGINANTPFYNVALGIAILIGRFAPLFAVLAIAGGMAGKKVAPPSSGTFATDSPTFVALLCSIIVIVGVLTYLPAFSLGPIVEHLLMLSGRTF
jgi:K+-transporting ATPase ATPase A chain